MRVTKKQLYEINIWPGFVDVLGTLLIVTIFTVLISTVTQIYFNDQLEIKRGEISSLDEKMNELANQLSMLRVEKKKIEKKFSNLSLDFQTLNNKKNILEEKLSKKNYDLKIKSKELNNLIEERSGLLEQIQQKTEEVIGPYELHDFFIYHFLRNGSSPTKIFHLANLAYEEKYSQKEIQKWLKLFFERFFSQQFKRTTLPPGPKIGSVSLSPRGDWRMPDEASATIYTKEIEALIS